MSEDKWTLFKIFFLLNTLIQFLQLKKIEMAEKYELNYKLDSLH